MNKYIRISFAAVAATFFLALGLPVRVARAQQAAAPEFKQEVPDNPSGHAPPEQPIPYSHKTHVALGLECKLCHSNPEPGTMMTFPPISTCMACHITVATKKPAILKLASFSKAHQQVPWVRVYTVLPGVNWTHRKHLAAGMKCQMCHGQVQEMEQMSQTTSVTTMAVCLQCHEAHGAATVCQTCHAWPAAQ